MAKQPPEDKARDEILRRMLNTPHKPHAKKAAKKKVQRKPDVKKVKT
jgi:hypothetical protein